MPASQLIFECAEPDDRTLATILISSHIENDRSKCHKQHENHAGNHDADRERILSDPIIDVKCQKRREDHQQRRDEKAQQSLFVRSTIVGGPRAELCQRFDVFGPIREGERLEALRCHVGVVVYVRYRFAASQRSSFN